MEHLNLFIAQVAIILLPGVIWARIDERYSKARGQTDLDFLVSVLIFGMASYAVTFVIYALIRQPFLFVDLKKAQDDTVLTAEIGWEIFSAIVVGIVLGLLWVYASTWKLLTRALQFIGATSRYGDNDLWDFAFNSPGPAARFVNVRDFDKRIVYQGRVNAFSETPALRELVLYEVELYDFDGNFLYDVPRLYIARKPDDIHVEFPTLAPTAAADG